jgi:hypothetical protein
VNLNITSNIPVNCTNALRRKANFVMVADDARQHARSGRGQRLIASCLNDACRHQGLVDVADYPADTEVPWFRTRVKCAKCRSRGNKIDVRPNWKEQPSGPSLVGKEWR